METIFKTKPPLLMMNKIVKYFPGILAVDTVNFVCKEGEIHGLIGENGAGKSTLMKILAGIYTPNDGDIFIQGKKKILRNPWEAKKAGIGIIYQELSLIPELSVAENIYMGNWLKKNRFVDWKEIKRNSKMVLHKIGIDLDPDELVKTLPMAIRQMVEIAKVLTQNPKIIIFDEPTAALSKEEVNTLFKIIQDLRKKREGIIFISHRLKEVLTISDVITVMKDGKEIITKSKNHFNENNIISYMVGRKLNEIFPEKAKILNKEKIFLFQGTLEKYRKKINFSVSKGEVLGIGGLQGQGQIELLQSIFGLDGCIESKMEMFGKEIKVRNPYQAVKQGISLVPENKNDEGVFLILSILENIAAPTIDRRTILGLIRKKEEKSTVDRVVKELTIKLTSVYQVAQSLSGGNLQKVVLAKWLISKPKMILLLEPTKGVDVATKQYIYKLIRELSNQDITIILYTSDMLELIGECDRVLVMNHGFITANLVEDKINEEDIMKASVSDLNILETEVKL
jgi:ABC-type sugar transport system ATPase subunit